MGDLGHWTLGVFKLFNLVVGYVALLWALVDRESSMIGENRQVVTNEPVEFGK